jgi:hypothetical protein
MSMLLVTWLGVVAIGSAFGRSQRYDMTGMPSLGVACSKHIQHLILEKSKNAKRRTFCSDGQKVVDADANLRIEVEESELACRSLPVVEHMRPDTNVSVGVRQRRLYDCGRCGGMPVQRPRQRRIVPLDGYNSRGV